MQKVPKFDLLREKPIVDFWMVVYWCNYDNLYLYQPAMYSRLFALLLLQFWKNEIQTEQIICS